MTVHPVAETTDAPGPGAQAANNSAVWQMGEYLAHYDHTELLPVEAILLARYREAVTGRVLDVGCGAGRLLRYLDLLGDDVHGVDLSERMVAHARSRLPGVDIHRADLRKLPSTEDGPFDAIVIPDNTIDVFDDRERRSVLRDLRELLSGGGLLLFAAHNLDCWDREGGELTPSAAWRTERYLRNVVRGRDGGRVRTALGPARAAANRRRLRSLQSRAVDHAIINDSAHNSSLLHYYISAHAQRRQLTQCGFETLEVLELNGTAVGIGEAGQSPWLYYVARPVQA